MMNPYQNGGVPLPPTRPAAMNHSQSRPPPPVAPQAFWNRPPPPPPIGPAAHFQGQTYHLPPTQPQYFPPPPAPVQFHPPPNQWIPQQYYPPPGFRLPHYGTYPNLPSPRPPPPAPLFNPPEPNLLAIPRNGRLPELTKSKKAVSAAASTDLSIPEEITPATTPTDGGEKKQKKVSEKGSTNVKVPTSNKKLDLYADIFIPAWLLEVNADQAFFNVPHEAPEPFDGQGYSSKFLTKHLLENSEKVESEAESEENEDALQEKESRKQDSIPLVSNKFDSPWSNNNSGSVTSISENSNHRENSESQKQNQNQKEKRRKKDHVNFSDERDDFDPTTPSALSEVGGEEYFSKEKRASLLEPKIQGANWGSGSGNDWTNSVGAVAQDQKSGQTSPIPSSNSTIFNSLDANVAASSLKQSSDSLSLEVSAIDIPIEQDEVPPLEASTYVARFQQLLSLEMDSRILDLSKQSLFEVGLKAYDPEDRDLGLWSLALPGIREDRPHLIPGDRVELRALASFSKSWLKLAFDAHITSVRAIEGKIVLDCKELEGALKGYYPSVEKARFNVIFHPRLKTERDSLDSFKVLESSLKRGHRVGNTLRRWLFPTEAHARFKNEGEGGKDRIWEGEMKHFDERLNEEQKDAVESISSRLLKIPYLISGPPGTGKTKTLTEAVLQVLHRQPQSTILLAAPSSTAADTLALRLAGSLKQGEMIRINDFSRTFAEVPEKLMLYCSIDEEKNVFCLPELKALMEARVIVTTTFDASLLVKARVTNSDLAKLNVAVASTIKPRKDSKDEVQDEGVPLHFTHLIIDETGQGTEAELSSLLATILPSKESSRNRDPVLVFCGDHNQLGARIQSHEARSNGLDISLLERLWDRPVYNQAMKRLREGRRRSTLKALNSGGLFSSSRNGLVPKESFCAHLVQNYRSRHPALLMAPSSLFYNDTLRPADLRKSELRNWNELPTKGFPLLFEGVEGEDKWVDEGVSWHNPLEAQKVIELIQSLTGIYRDPEGKFMLSNAGEPRPRQWVSASDIAVISPFREQVWRLRLALRKIGLSTVNVGTTEVFQGAEHLVTIISTVRTRERFLKDDMKNSLGLIYERKRFCVATTRAQELLIVVGNPQLLKVDPYWRSFLELVIRQKAYRGIQVDRIDPFSASDISVLESEEVGRRGAKSEHASQAITGRVVAEALEEEL